MSSGREEMEAEINQVESDKITLFKPSGRMGTTHWEYLWCSYIGVHYYRLKSMVAHVLMLTIKYIQINSQKYNLFTNG